MEKSPFRLNLYLTTGTAVKYPSPCRAGLSPRNLAIFPQFKRFASAGTIL